MTANVRSLNSDQQSREDTSPPTYQISEEAPPEYNLFEEVLRDAGIFWSERDGEFQSVWLTDNGHDMQNQAAGSADKAGERRRKGATTKLRLWWKVKAIGAEWICGSSVR